VFIPYTTRSLNTPKRLLPIFTTALKRPFLHIVRRPMPTGPKGERRPADVISNAVRVMRIATGEEPERLPTDDGKDPAAKALGKKGGAARAANLSPERRAEIAKKAATKRWARD
jgi:hypothetical protein